MVDIRTLESLRSSPSGRTGIGPQCRLYSLPSPLRFSRIRVTGISASNALIKFPESRTERIAGDDSFRHLKEHFKRRSIGFDGRADVTSWTRRRRYEALEETGRIVRLE